MRSNGVGSGDYGALKGLPGTSLLERYLEPDACVDLVAIAMAKFVRPPCKGSYRKHGVDVVSQGKAPVKVAEA